MDPLIIPVAAAAEHDPHELLAAYRARLRRTPWGHETPDTLLSPVHTPEPSVRRFESAVLTLFRAHLKVLHAIEVGGPHEGAAAEYARLEKVVRAYYLNWPVLGSGEPLDPDALLTDEAVDLLVGRPDVVLGEDGPKVVETNLDTAAAGHERPDDLWTIAAELFEPSADHLTTGRPLFGLRDYFLELAGDTPHHVYWIMKNDPVTRRELAPTFQLLNEDTTTVRHSIHYAGEPPELDTDRPSYLHRACSIFTVNRDRTRFAGLLDRLAPRVRGCTVPLGLSRLASKLFLAWLSDPHARPATLTSQEHRTVDAMVPWTRVLSLLGNDELNQVRRDRGEFVLKKADSHQARDVHFGCDVSGEEWAALLDRHREQLPETDGAPNIWIVQQRVRPREYELTEYTDTGIEYRRTGLSCCPYLMGGRLRGLETWVLPTTPNLEMIKRMHFVPHYIRQSRQRTQP